MLNRYENVISEPKYKSQVYVAVCDAMFTYTVLNSGLQEGIFYAALTTGRTTFCGCTSDISSGEKKPDSHCNNGHAPKRYFVYKASMRKSRRLILASGSSVTVHLLLFV